GPRHTPGPWSLGARNLPRDVVGGGNRAAIVTVEGATPEEDRRDRTRRDRTGARTRNLRRRIRPAAPGCRGRRDAAGRGGRWPRLRRRRWSAEGGTAGPAGRDRVAGRGPQHGRPGDRDRRRPGSGALPGRRLGVGVPGRRQPAR